VVLPGPLAQPSPALNEASRRSSIKKEAIFFATAGSKGCIRVWSSKKKQPLVSLEGLVTSDKEDMVQGNTGEDKGNDEDSVHDREGSSSEGGYTGLHYSEETGQLVAITYDQNIVFYNSSSFEMDKQVMYCMSWLAGGEETFPLELCHWCLRL